MDLLIQLFSDWVGILSFAVIFFIIFMAVYMYKMVLKNIAEDSKKAAANSSES